jgi:hypothetical protein
MVAHSKAYETFTHSMEQQLDFVVLVSYAVPVLKRNIAADDQGGPSIPINPPDYFVQRRLSKPQLGEFMKSYEHELARTLILASFAYFEAYVKAIIKEFIDFQGGPKQFLDTALRRSTRSMRGIGGNLLEAKRKVQEPEKPGKHAKYAKYAAELAQAGFRFPSEILAVYGVRKLLEKVSKDRRLELKAGEIPTILIDAFQMDSFQRHVADFESARKLRNELAHGLRQQVLLKHAVDTGRQIRQWGATVDSHFMEHFFVQEQHAG